MTELEQSLKKSIEAIKKMPWDLSISHEEKERIFNLLAENDTLWQRCMKKVIIDSLTDFDGEGLPEGGFFEIIGSGQAKINSTD